MSVSINPSISCIMAVNRDDGFLDEAVNSILNQTFADFEFIIVANACTEELWSKLNAIQDSRIRLFRTEIGQLPFNLNFAINEAKGKIIARMDADDVAMPQRFEKQIEFLKANPEVSVLGTAVEIIDETNKPQQIETMPETHESIAKEMVWQCSLIHPSIMFRREVILKARGYAYTLFGEDYELWLRMLRLGIGRFANLSQVLLKYRVHGKQSTSKDKFRANFAEMAALLFREFLLTGKWIFLVSILKRFIGQSALAKIILAYPYRMIKKFI